MTLTSKIDIRAKFPMNTDDSDHKILQRLKDNSVESFAELFSEFKERLRRIIRFRLDYRLTSRISESDILQECYVRAADRLSRYLDRPDYPFFVWLRMQAHQQVADVHRKHLVAEKRDARREIRLKGWTEDGNQTSVQLAARLIADLTSPSRLIQKSEEIQALEKSIESMNEMDREIIALRHFEELTSRETAQVLGIEPATASKRYVRALQRLREVMAQHGFVREGKADSHD